MRPEEEAELRRRDVDLDTMTIRVRQAAPELSTGRRAVGSGRSSQAHMDGSTNFLAM